MSDMKKQMSPLHLIYIPGLGDARALGQAKAVQSWRWFGVEAEMLRMNWNDDEAWEIKSGRLLTRIDELTADGRQVALVGASAGATAVITAFAVRPEILGCVVIAGKANHPETINERYRQESPSFVAAAYACEQALSAINTTRRKRIVSRYAFYDEVLKPEDSYIAGAHNRRLLSIGHAITIATQITLGVPIWLRFLRRLQLAGQTSAG